MQTETEFKSVLSRLRSLRNIHRGPVLKTPYRPDLGEDEKIAGLSLFWATVKDSFVYFDRLPEPDWDRVSKHSVPRMPYADTVPAGKPPFEFRVLNGKIGYTTAAPSLWSSYVAPGSSLACG